MDDYGPDVNVYSAKAIVDFPKAAEIITEESIPERKVSRAVPKGKK
ncbi:MAG: hypothetical protein GY940_36600 [bacterium]|nr:hypothetical protein [bacterium]